MDKARYASPRKSRYGSIDKGALSAKMVAIAAVVFVILLVIVVGRYFYSVRAANVSASGAGYHRIDDHHIVLRVDVTRHDTSVPTYCIVLAKDYDKSEVGRREFLVAPGGSSTQRFSVTIPTRAVAVAASVYGCSASVPAYLATPTKPIQG